MNTKVLLVAALVAAVGMTSCINDNVAGEERVINGEIRLSSISINPKSYSIAQNLQATQFDAAESIGVFINENTASPTTTYPQPLTYTADGSGGMNPPVADQPYFPTSGNGVNIYAFYPATAATALSTPATFSIMANQSTDANYKASDLMYGVPASNPVTNTGSVEQLTFKHLLSKINIELISGTGNPNLIGAVVKLKGIRPSTTFNPQAGTISAATGTATDVTVMTTDATLKGSAIIIPQNLALNSVFIEVTLAGSTIALNHRLATAVSIQSEMQYNYQITVNRGGLTVNSTITDWGNGGTVSGSAEE